MSGGQPQYLLQECCFSSGVFLHFYPRDDLLLTFNKILSWLIIIPSSANSFTSSVPPTMVTIVFSFACQTFWRATSVKYLSLWFSKIHKVVTVASLFFGLFNRVREPPNKGCFIKKCLILSVVLMKNKKCNLHSPFLVLPLWNLFVVKKKLSSCMHVNNFWEMEEVELFFNASIWTE